jgi:hypothetical protein
MYMHVCVYILYIHTIKLCRIFRNLENIRKVNNRIEEHRIIHIITNILPSTLDFLTYIRQVFIHLPFYIQ